MSGITDNTATQAHDLVEQAEQEEQKVQGGDAITGQVEAGAVAPSAAESGQVDDQGQQQHKSKMEKVKEALHLKK